MSGAAPAARTTDKLKHTSAMLGFFAGAVAALAVGVFVIGTGGLGLAALVAVGGLAGAGAATLIDSMLEDPGITTGAVGPGSNNILINNLDAVAVIDPSLCYFPVVYNHGNKAIVEGSKTVFYGCRPAARKGDTLLCEAKITTGSPNVLIGGEKVRIKGTRRSALDTILDYGSMYLTVLFAGGSLAGLAVTGAFMAISETLSYRMHQANQSTSNMQAGMNVAGSVSSTATENALTHRGNVRAEQLATDTYQANRQAVSNAMYQRYVQGKIRSGQPYQAQSQWARNNRVRWAVNRRTPPRVAPTRAKPNSWKVTAGAIVAQLTVDIIRNYREEQREAAIPTQVSCDDTSWLEPA
jgi:uncharacterized Zn-binding protein involved in type VI secretion